MAYYKDPFVTFEDQIGDLQFENQQLHVYTDDLETKLRNIKSFLQQGITLHKNLIALKNTPETRKFLDFLQDAISIVQDNQHIPVAKEVKPQQRQVKLPQLKSLKDLPKSPRNKKPSPRRVKELIDEDLDFKLNIYDRQYRK